jgi:hypothetical protein
MTARSKRNTLILLALVIAITIIIAAGLPQLDFKPGMPPPRLDHGKVVAVQAEATPFVSISTSNFMLVLLAIILVWATLYSAYQLLRGADWKLILEYLRLGLIISAAMICLVLLVMVLPSSENYTPIEIPIATPQPAVTSPVGSVPTSLIWLVGIGLFMLCVLVMMWILKPSQKAKAIELVGLEAQKARQALLTGVDFKDVIVNCYLRMSLALKQEQGIERKDFMTTGEFETLLEAAGIPHEPLHQLTRLFDAVRYGNWQPNAVDEQTAVQCLEVIMLHSRDAQGMN